MYVQCLHATSEDGCVRVRDEERGRKEGARSCLQERLKDTHAQ